MNTKKYISFIVTLATFGSLALAMPAFAQTAGQPPAGGGRFGRGMADKPQLFLAWFLQLAGIL